MKYRYQLSFIGLIIYGTLLSTAFAQDTKEASKSCTLHQEAAGVVTANCGLGSGSEDAHQEGDYVISATGYGVKDNAGVIPDTDKSYLDITIKTIGVLPVPVEQPCGNKQYFKWERETSSAPAIASCKFTMKKGVKYEIRIVARAHPHTRGSVKKEDVTMKAI